MQLKSSKLLLGILIILISFSAAFASTRIFRINDIKMDTHSFMEGDVVEGTIFIENRDDKIQQYQLELVYDNKIFKQGTPRFIQPGETAEQNFFLELPNKESLWVTFRVHNERTSLEHRRHFLISLKTRDFNVDLNKNAEIFMPGETETFTIKLFNKGTLPDTYKISIENWDNFEIEQEIIKLERFTSSEISFNVFVPENTLIGTYDLDIIICNLDNKCKTEKLEIQVYLPEREQSIIKIDENQLERQFSRTGEPIEFEFSVKNIGSEEKRYTFLIEREESKEELIINIGSPEFNIKSGETKTATFSLTPATTSDYVVFLAINAQGNRIYREKIEIEYTPGFGALTGMFFSDIGGGVGGTGLIFTAVLIIGIGGYFLFRYMQTNVWKEKAVDYTEKHPRKLTNNFPEKGGYVNEYNNK